MKAIVQFSGGAGSFAAAVATIERYGVENTTLLFADTLIEDEDLYRFLDDAERALGMKITRLADGRTPWELFRDEKFIGNTRVDLCSRVLKRDLLREWIFTHGTPDDTVVVLGIDWTEIHRLERAIPRWEPWKLWAPLCEEPYADKHEVLAAHGIASPRLYAMGFPHNNCGGFCVKAGHSQFKLLLERLPERFAHHEAEEARTAALIGKNVAILRDRSGGKSRPLPLSELRERIQGGVKVPDDEWGGCGCALD